ncbi:MAG: TraB/GumN family protein [Collimonas sp.]|uniref:TraB/GumN family protein n=1 Tax=Collimonas sp. TaxID=1963772 RepID=UPI003265A5FD
MAGLRSAARLLAPLPCPWPWIGPRQLLLTLGLGALLAGAPPLFAQDGIAAASLQPAASVRQGGAMFQIQRGGHSAYVFGTIHVGKADFYPLDTKVLQAIQQSSCIALEIDPNNSQGMIPLIKKYGIYPDGQSHQKDLPPKLQRQLAALLEKYGMAPDQVASLKPWLIATMLGINEYSSQGYLSQYGVDTTLANLAKSSNKRLVELETAEAQLSLLGSLSLTEQVRFLQDSVDEIQDPAKAQRSLELVNLWRSGDVDGLAAMLAEMNAEDTFASKLVQRALLDGRNPGLADGIAKLANSSDYPFVAIGMLHLVGPNSVLAILQQRGYSVKRVY